MSVDTKLTAIADAIRDKTNTTDLLSLDDMASAVDSIEVIEGIPDTINFTGDCTSQFANNKFNWICEALGDRVTTNNITNATQMFRNSSTLTKVPFDLNLKDAITFEMFAGCYQLANIGDIYCNHTSGKDMTKMFYSASALKQPPYIYNAKPNGLDRIFSSCDSIREFPENYFDTWDFSIINTGAYNKAGYFFSSCYSLRKCPNLNKLGKETVSKQNGYLFYYYAFENCHSLDEIINFPVTPATLTSSLCSPLYYNGRLKNFTFETNEDGSPIVANWKSQNINISNYAGYVYSGDKQLITKYNSGITADKEVKDDATYQALKNNPDWFTGNIAYSRYNHDSAVRTINSLPDTSAYLATAGGTNTITFKGAEGSATDGGAVNTLTDAEIAVASAKGWTVAFK